ncbi:MAG: Rab family GTPase [Candidatus Thorarchaeota archaeon]
MSTNDIVLKICSIGSFSVGKTSLIRRFADWKFSTNYLPTIGVDYTIKRIALNDKLVKLLLADTAGQEVFGKIRSSYYLGSLGCLVVFALNDRKSFNAVPHWIKEFRNTVNPQSIVVLVGNKNDLINERVISSEDAQSMAKEYDVSYYETSALWGGREIIEIFHTLASNILNLIKKPSTTISAQHKVV